MSLVYSSEYKVNQQEQHCESTTQFIAFKTNLQYPSIKQKYRNYLSVT